MNRILFWIGLALPLTLIDAGCGGRFNCLVGPALCVDGACVCQSPFSRGKGNFACYRDSEVSAEIKNDPNLFSFNNEFTPFPFPCRYLVTHVKQRLIDKENNELGQCELEIYAYNAKAANKGKFFVHGFDVTGRLSYNFGGSVKFSSRNYGTAENGEYTFEQKGKWDEYLPNGPWNDDKISWEDDQGVNVSITKDEVNNRLLFNAVACGVLITFVPYDDADPNGQTSVPGLSVAINKDSNLQFLDHGKVMALAPLEAGGRTYSQILIGGLSEDNSMLTRAFINRYEQVQPYSDNGKCIQTGAVLSNCRHYRGELVDAYNSCQWVLREPRFIRCYDDTNGAEKILNLFGKCIDMWCGDSRCSEVQGLILESGCYPKITNIGNLTNFMDGRMCP